MTRKEELFTLALTLAITAPTDEKADDCTALAENIAAGLTEDQIEACKAEALRIVEAHP
jgi:hypothetical protein